MLFHHRASSDLFGALAVSAGFSGRFLDVFVLPLLFGAGTSYMTFNCHNILFSRGCGLPAGSLPGDEGRQLAARLDARKAVEERAHEVPVVYSRQQACAQRPNSRFVGRACLMANASSCRSDRCCRGLLFVAKFFAILTAVLDCGDDARD